MSRVLKKALSGTLSVAIALASIADAALAGTRAVYVANDGTVITGRSMDWKEDMFSNLWIFPAAMTRDGAAGPRSIKWVSKYGSVIVSGYEVGSTDGMNEKGLVANLLFLAEADYGKPDQDRSLLSVSTWAQYVLDNFATVSEAVSALAGVSLLFTGWVHVGIALASWKKAPRISRAQCIRSSLA